MPDAIKFKNIKLLNEEFECEDVINTELFHGFNRTFRKRPTISVCESRLLSKEAISYLKWLQKYADVYMFDINGTPTKRLIKNLEEQLKNVTFLGFVDPIARASLFRQSDAVFILNNGKYTEFEMKRIKNRVSISLSHCEVLDLSTNLFY